MGLPICLYHHTTTDNNNVIHSALSKMNVMMTIVWMLNKLNDLFVCLARAARDKKYNRYYVIHRHIYTEV